MALKPCSMIVDPPLSDPAQGLFCMVGFNHNSTILMALKPLLYQLLSAALCGYVLYLTAYPLWFAIVVGLIVFIVLMVVYDLLEAIRKL